MYWDDTWLQSYCPYKALEYLWTHEYVWLKQDPKIKFMQLNPEIYKYVEILIIWNF